MAELQWRIGLVLLVVAIAVAIALIGRRRAYHPPVDISGLGLPPGLIVFTSTACTRCKEVLATAKALGVPLREVTYELEPDLQESAGVTGVPLTLVVDAEGTLVTQIAGAVSARRLRRATQAIRF